LVQEKPGWMVLNASDFVVRAVRIDPREDPGRHWTAEDLAERLAEEGVRHGILGETLIALAEELNRSGAPIFNTVVATGTVAQAEATIPLLPTGAFVLPGDPLASCQESRQGKTVYGLEVPPPPGKVSRAGLNVVLDEVEGAMRADVYGRVFFAGGRIEVDSLIRVSSDRMQATVDIVARSASEREVELADIEQALERRGVVHGILIENLLEGLAKAWSTGAPTRGVLAARGTPAVNGADGRLLPLRKGQRSVGRTDDDTGRIDFRERDTVQNIEEGDVVCRLIQASEDLSGTDIFGKALPGAPGKALRLPKLENVRFDEERLEFVATAAGGLLYSEEMVAVTPIFVVQGDVNFETGSLHAKMASVHVKGDVLDRFEITTQGSVTVDGCVGDATIICGQDLTVGSGVVMKENGRIEAGGSVSARYLQNAKVVAGGDIRVGESAIGCQFEAAGEIVARQGKGRIIGGTHKARRGLMARVFGSEREVATELVVSSAPVFDQFAASGKRIRRDLKEIALLIGNSPTQEGGARLAAPKRIALHKLVRYMQLAQRYLCELNDLRDPMLAAASRAAADVTVVGVMHGGARVTILGQSLTVKRPLESCRIVYDPRTRRLVSKPLGSPAKRDAPAEPDLSGHQSLEERTLSRLAAMNGELDRLDLPLALRTMRDLLELGTRILVVDDKRPTRIALSRMLELWGYTVYQNCGREVIPAVIENAVDLVMLDICLPGGRSGIEILKQIRQLQELHGLPVIMMTAHNSKEVVAAALLNKADDLLLKPFTMKAVRAKVERIFSRQKGEEKREENSPVKT